MKLRNKKTGGIGKLSVYTDGHVSVDDATSPWTDNTIGQYYSLAELNEEWEDYEEPEGWWFIDTDSDNKVHATNSTLRDRELDEEIGNYFSSKEEAERAFEKLKAWKRLKDKGFRFKDYTRKFDGFKRVDGNVFILAELDDEGAIGMIDELNTCFGGEDE